MDDICEPPRWRASPELGNKKTPLTHGQGRERLCRFVVPPCFTRPSRGRALPGTDIPWRCDGRARRGLRTPLSLGRAAPRPCSAGPSVPVSSCPGSLCRISPLTLPIIAFALLTLCPAPSRRAQNSPSTACKTYSLTWLMLLSLARQSAFVNGTISPEWEGTGRPFLSLPTKTGQLTSRQGSVSPSTPACSGCGARPCGPWRW